MLKVKNINKYLHLVEIILALIVLDNLFQKLTLKCRKVNIILK